MIVTSVFVFLKSEVSTYWYLVVSAIILYSALGFLDDMCAAVVGLAVLVFDEGQWTLLEMLCLTSALWIDALLTFIRRAFRGFKVTQAHRSHLYQYAIRSGSSHAAVSCYYAIWTVAAIAIIGLSRQLLEIRQQILLIAIIATACVLHQYLRLFVLKSDHGPRIPKSLL